VIHGFLCIKRVALILWHGREALLDYGFIEGCKGILNVVKQHAKPACHMLNLFIALMPLEFIDMVFTFQESSDKIKRKNSDLRCKSQT
jgi:hypothetical protein